MTVKHATYIGATKDVLRKRRKMKCRSKTKEEVCLIHDSDTSCCDEGEVWDLVGLVALGWEEC